MLPSHLMEALDLDLETLVDLDEVDLDLVAEEALEHLMVMVLPLLLLVDRSVRMFPVSSATRFPVSNARMFPDRSATMSQDSSARMFPDRSPGRSAPMFPGSSARMFLASSATMFPDRSARMCQDRNARMFLASSVSRCPGELRKRFVRTFPE